MGLFKICIDEVFETEKNILAFYYKTGRAFFVNCGNSKWVPGY